MPVQSFPDYFDPVETASRAWLDQFQEGAIVAISAHAYASAPLIREVWDAAKVKPGDIKSMKDFLEKAPIIDKDDVRRFRDANGDPSGGMSRSIPGETISIGTTSGTTGDPTPVPNWVTGGSEQAYARDTWHMGLRPGDHLLHMLFTFRGGHRRRHHAQHGITEVSFSIGPDEVARAVEGALRYRPTIWSMTSTPVLLMLEHYFETHDVDPVDVFSSFKGAIFGGEPLSGRLLKLTQSWGFQMFETTSLGEVSGATECKMHDGFHAYDDMTFIETVDPVTREPIADGLPGELVTTTLHDRLTPLVRYGTGDLAVIDRSPCGCGRNHARFKVMGRTTDQILIDGRSILPREIMGLIEGHSETRASLFQIIRSAREMDMLRLRIGYDAARLQCSLDALRDRLHGVIAEAIGVPLHVELIDEQELLKLGPPPQNSASNQAMSMAGDRPDVVGSYNIAGKTSFYAARYDEIDRQAICTARILRSFGFAPGSMVLVVSMVQEIVQFGTFEKAVQILGMYGINAENSPFDAGRVEAICRQFSPVATCGVGTATLEGLKSFGHDPATVFKGSVVWARPEAYAAVAALDGVEARRIVLLGPAVALECHHGGLHYDNRDWTLTTQDGTLRLSSRMPRVEPLDGLDTRVAGTVSPLPCSCGAKDAIITLAD